MSAEKTHTKREVQELQRAAFIEACRLCATELPQWPWQAEHLAATRYPLPKVTRPRVVKDTAWPGTEWRFVEDHFEMRTTGDVHRGGWLRFVDWSKSDIAPLPKRVRIWADLLANPTEEVEE